MTVALLSFSSLAGCASATNGSSQKLFIYSNPEAADCKIYQGGLLKEQFKTPHYVKLQRSREQDLILNCAKSGYQLFAKSWDPDLTAAYMGNTGGFLVSLVSLSAFIPASGIFAGGAAYDQAHQSAYGYPKDIEVEFRPLKKGSPEEALPENFQKPSDVKAPSTPL
ncbi:hypothetical protein FAI40_03275 [Acetobacteraceae bacterium]|nr:hypothetical protein FAI40_03275 [Acetobacteraceae bacterium]